MLTGRRVFEAETISDAVARILRDEPDWNRLPRALQPGLRLILQRCLEKDPNRRLQHIGDVKILLEEVSEEKFELPAPANRSRRPILWAGVAAALAALVFVVSY